MFEFLLVFTIVIFIILAGISSPKTPNGKWVNRDIFFTQITTKYKLRLIGSSAFWMAVGMAISNLDKFHWTLVLTGFLIGMGIYVSLSRFVAVTLK